MSIALSIGSFFRYMKEWKGFRTKTTLRCFVGSKYHLPSNQCLISYLYTSTLTHLYNWKDSLLHTHT